MPEGARGARGGVVQRRDGRECARDVDVAVGQTAGVSASKLSAGAGCGAPMRQGQGLPGCGAASSSDVTGGGVCETSTWLSDSGVFDPVGGFDAEGAATVAGHGWVSDDGSA